MSDRIRRRRRSDRRVFLWCIGIAAGFHVVVFAGFPRFRAGDAPFPIFSDDLTVEEGAVPLELFFGPPAISNDAGEVSLEPPERVLEAERVVYMQPGCRAIIGGSGTVIRGSVRLRVRSTGLVDVMGVVRSTGVRCGDDVMETVAGELWYRWLPSEEFPAPVELVQPVSLAEKVGP